MYIPPAYKAPDPRAVVRDHPFATLFSAKGPELFATATPIHFETDDAAEMRLVGHMAGANPHAASISEGDPVLAVFSGPHAYISASWYVDYPTVPTWDYVAAQAEGTIHPVDDDAGRLAILDRTIRLAEAGNPTPWTREQAPAGKVDALLAHIRAFRIHITELSAATKLSQTHPAGDRARIVTGLRDRDAPGDQDVADLIAKAAP
ncbi:MAG: FMN-binding negative transcriptional regulator [Sphingomonadales bacterium]|nr:FMN-binding negative transcriptional regulator [Sphingomonadales bacterium]